MSMILKILGGALFIMCIWYFILLIKNNRNGIK